MKRLLIAVAALTILTALPAQAARDNTPPAAVTDLSISTGFHTAGAFWTNTGDDGTVGTATLYQVRYSTSPITESNWNQAQVLCSGSPLPSGVQQCCSSGGLNPGTTYYFAIRLRDDAHNWSPLSNVVQATTKTSGSEVQC